MDAELRQADAQWLQQLCDRFVTENDGWLVVDATHMTCDTLWLAVVHRDSMGRLECPVCAGREGYVRRVYGNDEEGRIKRMWPDLAPIIHRADGSIEEGPCAD